VNEKIVFGLGDQNASLLLVGDATGEQDALQFEPFVGPALKLLDKILLAINCSRQKDVYICNVLKDEPPKNKVFLPIEENESESYLFHQINLIKPKLIVALGRVAGMRLLNVDNSLKSMRGVIHDYNKTPLIVTYHPIDLLEDFNRKSEAWKDFKWIRSLIE
jgi:DNA polymerase